VELEKFPGDYSEHVGSGTTALPQGVKKGGIVREFGMDMYTLLYLKRTTNKSLLYSTGDFAQFYVTT